MSNDETAVSPSTGSANKRNSSGDAINNTVNGIPAPSSLVPGTRLEARDGLGSDKWFSVKVQEVDVEESEVLVHYHNWNSRHDEWIPIDSPRLRVPHRTSNRHDSGSMTSNSCDEGRDPAHAGGGDNPGGMGIKGPAMKEFKSGEKVMAVWKLNRKYPAKIVRFEPDGTYLVEFCEDGVECKVKPNNIRRMRKEEEEQFGIEMGTNGIDSYSHESASHVEEEVETARSSRRRERKMKFDLKSVLNIRTTPPSTPPPPQVGSDKTNKITKSKSDSKQKKKNSDASNKNLKGVPKTDSFDLDGSSNIEIDSKNQPSIKKETEAKQLPRKKQPNQYTKRREELEKKQNLMKEANGSGNLSKKESSNSDDSKRNKNKKNSSKSLAPVTNGNESADKKSVNKILSNNNSSKSNVASSADKVNVNDAMNTESYNSKSVEIVQTVTGKRKRKPKKFWDDAEEESSTTVPPTKLPKKKTCDGTQKDSKPLVVDNSTVTNKNKNRRSSESLVSSKSTVKSKSVDVQIKATDVLEKSKPTKLNNSSSDDLKTNSNKTSKKEEQSSKRNIQHEALSNVNSISVNDKFKKSENGKILLYKTSFDMTEDPSKIAAKMKEGVNIPGPGVSIPVDSSRLPKGWEKRVIQRGIGVTKGKWDVFIVEEEGRKSFRSKTDLQRHIDEKKLPYTSDAFDFSLDDNLKKLRQIWKQYIVKPRLKPGEKMSPLVPAKKGKKKNEVFSHVASLHSAQLSSLSELQLTTHPFLPTKPISQLNSPASSVDYPESGKAHLSNDFGMDVDNTSAIVSDEMIEQNRVLQRQEREAELIATKLGVLSETGQGLRCSVQSCGKLFRREKLLRQHVKHYHPKEYKEIISSSKLQCDHDGEMRPPNFDKKRKLSQSSLDLINENKRLKRNSLGLHSQLSGDEDDLEIDSPSPLNSLTANAVRKRNDSMLSASSGMSEGDVFSDKLISPLESHSHVTWSGNNYSKTKGRTIPSSPSTPPTFRFSRRRQAQLRANRRNDLRTSPREVLDSGSSKTSKNIDETVLSNSMSPKVALTILDDSVLASPALRLSEQQLSPAAGCSQANSPSVVLNSTGQSSYPPSEMDVLSVTGSEHLTTDELVNCSCRRLEEDGLMIQCDICLCWQHGSCLAIEEEDQVPEYYICETCRNPRLGRTSAKYSIDQDWLNKGALPNVLPSRLTQDEAIPSSNLNVQSSFPSNSKQSSLEKDVAFRKLSELMADLANLSKLLHSLRVKLHIASQSNNTKVFMWSSLWDQPSKLVASPPKTEELFPNLDDPHLNSGGMLAMETQSAVHSSGDDTIANISMIPSDNSHNFSAEHHRTNLSSSQIIMDNNLAASSNLCKVNNDIMNISQDMKIAKNDCSEIEGQPILPSIKSDVPPLTAKTSQNGPNDTGSSTYACPKESNTPLSQTQTELRLVNDANSENKNSAPNLPCEDKSMNGKLIKDLSPQNNPDSSNVNEKAQIGLETDISPTSNLKDDSSFSTTKLQEDGNFKIPVAFGHLVNGQISKKFTENDACKETNHTESDKASKLHMNGSLGEDCKDQKLTFDTMNTPTELVISNNKENVPGVASPMVNGENHMAEKNNITTNNIDPSKNISLATDVKNFEHSTNNHNMVDKPVSKNSEPQINGIHEETPAETSPGAGNITDINGLLQTNKDQHNGEMELSNTDDASLTNICAASDKSLGKNDFAEPTHDVLLDENQEVDPSMIPSLSEVQQLLPSLMSSLEEQLLNDQQQVEIDASLDETASCMNSLTSEVNNIASLDVSNQPLQQFHNSLIPPAPVSFPETKRIDKDECRLNLMHHIDAVQTEFERRLNLIESTLAEIDSNKTGTNPSHSHIDTDEDPDPTAKTKAILTLLLNDLRTSKNLVSLG